jgi:hypothetical protein
MMSRLSFSLPLVAYRGLWDKFAAPGSLDAFRRAYVRGVPCVIRTDDDLPNPFDICALVNNPLVNRRGQALYLAASIYGMSGVRVLSRWTGSLWTPCGVYVPARSAANPLDPADFVVLDSMPSPVVLVESFNVLDRDEELAVANGLSDADVLLDVEAMAGSSARVARVSDFVELDQLERVRRQAA